MRIPNQRHQPGFIDRMVDERTGVLASAIRLRLDLYAGEAPKRQERHR